jgi:hypothetical protein
MWIKPGTTRHQYTVFPSFKPKVVSILTEKIKVFGGPGCGKTSIIKEFYQKYLLDGYKPTEITVLTFRKTAATDLIGATIPYAGMREKELKQLLELFTQFATD